MGCGDEIRCHHQNFEEILTWKRVTFRRDLREKGIINEGNEFPESAARIVVVVTEHINDSSGNFGFCEWESVGNENVLLFLIQEFVDARDHRSQGREEFSTRGFETLERSLDSGRVEFVAVLCVFKKAVQGFAAALLVSNNSRKGIVAAFSDDTELGDLLVRKTQRFGQFLDRERISGEILHPR